MNKLLVSQIKIQPKINLQSWSRNIHMDKDDITSQIKKKQTMNKVIHCRFTYFKYPIIKKK